jgi:hypothetical protein
MENIIKTGVLALLMLVRMASIAATGCNQVTARGSQADTLECPICKDNLSDDPAENITLLTIWGYQAQQHQCTQHPYHRSCIIRWFNNTTVYNCPVCNQPVLEAMLNDLGFSNTRRTASLPVEQVRPGLQLDERHRVFHRRFMRTLMGRIPFNQDLVNLILNNDLDVNMPLIANRRAIHLAVQYQNLDLVNALLRRQDLEVNAPDFDGRSALDIANQNGYQQIAAVLGQAPERPVVRRGIVNRHNWLAEKISRHPIRTLLAALTGCVGALYWVYKKLLSPARNLRG